MKTFIITLVLLLCTSMAFAEQYCMWDGSQGTNCQSDAKGYVRLPSGLPIGGGASNYNDNGYFLLTTTQPTVGADQVKDAEVWGKVDNDISLTWTVRDMTTAELDERTASTMSFEMYKVLSWMATEGYIVPSTAPTGIKDAYLAKERLEQ